MITTNSDQTDDCKTTCHTILRNETMDGCCSLSIKHWLLTRNESITSFETWKQNLIYILFCYANFAHSMRDNVSWERKSSSTPTRGLVNDSDDIPEAEQQRRNAYISNSCWGKLRISPIISRNSLVKTSTSLTGI